MIASVSDVELRIELLERQRQRIRMPVDVVGVARRRFPGVVVRADLAVAAREQAAQHLGRLRIASPPDR